MTPPLPPSRRLSRKSLLFVALGLVFGAVAADGPAGPNQKMKLEASVQTEPHPRIASVQMPGESSLLFSDPTGERTGIRFVALEEIDGRQKEWPFVDSAEPLAKKDGAAGFIAETGTDGERLRLTVQVNAAAKPGAIQLQCTLANLSARPRTLALWTIASLPNEGWVLTTVSRAIENGRRRHAHLASYWSSPLNASCLRLGTDALAFDLSGFTGEPSVKFGTRSAEGWAAAINLRRKVLLLGMIPYSPTARYPDEDCNITLWAGRSPSGVAYAEMEWLSPLTVVAPGGVLEWTLTLEARAIDPGGIPGTADGLVTLVRSPKERAALTSHHETAAWSVDTRNPLVVDTFGRVTRIANARDQDSDAEPWAIAPLWSNAPSLSTRDDGDALLWNPDTLLEVPPAAVPPWTEGSREWTVDFAAKRGAENRILFQDGGSESGVAVYCSAAGLTALLWDLDHEESPIQIVAPLEPGDRHRASIRLSPSTGQFSVQVDDLPARTKPVPFAIPRPEPRLAIGRDLAAPKDFDGPPLTNFEGHIHRMAIYSEDP